MTKKKTPEPHWLNKRAMCKSLGISTQAFDKWGVEPVSRHGREAFYQVKDVLKNRLDHLRDSTGAGKQISEIDKQKARLAKEQADGAALKNAQLRKELAPVSVISWTLNTVGTKISAILEAVPLKAKKHIPTLTATQVNIIKREIVKAQNVASKIQLNFDEYRRSIGD